MAKPIPNKTPGVKHPVEQRVKLGAAVAGFVALLGWGLNTYVLPMEKPLTVEAGAGLTGVLTYVAQWWTRGRLT